MKTAIYTDTAPAVIGTYSQAIRCNHTIYLSGQIPLDVQTMELCSNEIHVQIHQVFKNLVQVCLAANGNLDNIVKLNIYMLNLNDFNLVNTIMAEYFQQPYPARAVIGVMTLPRAAQIEMDAIMVLETIDV